MGQLGSRGVVTVIVQGWHGLWWRGPMGYLFMGPKNPGGAPGPEQQRVHQHGS